MMELVRLHRVSTWLKQLSQSPPLKEEK
jgi:hypothetical protein